MDSSDLTPEQAAKLAAAVRPALHYLTKLQQRMEQTHFPPSDKLLVLVREAQAAMQTLYVELHYQSCRSGVGRKRGG